MALLPGSPGCAGLAASMGGCSLGSLVVGILIIFRSCGLKLEAVEEDRQAGRAMLENLDSKCAGLVRGSGETGRGRNRVAV
jgi:hypothetical protein